MNNKTENITETTSENLTTELNKAQQAPVVTAAPATKSKATFINDIDNISRITVHNYIANNDIKNMSPSLVTSELLRELETEYQFQNSIKPEGAKWKIPQRLKPEWIALLLQACGNVKLIDINGTNLIAVYKEGIWHIINDNNDNVYLNDIIRRFCSCSTKECSEVKSYLASYMLNTEDCTCVTHNEDYIAVNNGVWDFRNQKLIEFEDAKDQGLVFTSKLAVRYDPNAQNITYHDAVNDVDIDVDTLVNSWFDSDPDHVAALWDSWHLILRGNCASAEGAVLIVDPHYTGDNGKSTAGFIIQQIIGDNNYATINLNDLKSGKFLLQSLLTSNAIINTDGDDAEYIDSSGLFKKLACNEPIDINIKHKAPIASYRYYGKMWYTFNGFPRFKDVSGAIDKRLYIIDFNVRFTNKKNPDIKNEFLKDKRVLEYILKRLLEMDVRKFKEYPFQRDLKQRFREETNPVDAFLTEITDPENRGDESKHWSMYPLTWLYSAFCGWYKMNYNKNASMSNRAFNTSAQFWCEKHPEWEMPRTADNSAYRKVSCGNMMDNPECFSEDYNDPVLNNMCKWINFCGSSDFAKYSLWGLGFDSKKRYTCIRKVSASND